MKNLKYLLFSFICMFTCLISVNAAERYQSQILGGGSLIGGTYSDLIGSSCESGEILYQGKKLFVQPDGAPIVDESKTVAKKYCISYSGMNINFGTVSVETYDNLLGTPSCYSPADINQDGVISAEDVSVLLWLSVNNYASFYDSCSEDRDYCGNNPLMYTVGGDEIRQLMIKYYNDRAFLRSRLNGTSYTENTQLTKDIYYSFAKATKALEILQILDGKYGAEEMTSSTKQYVYGSVCHLPLKENAVIESSKDAVTGVTTSQNATLVSSTINGKNWKYPQLYLKLSSNYVKLSMPTVNSTSASGFKVATTAIDNDVFAGKKLDKNYNNIYIALKWESGKTPEILVYGISLSQFDKVLTTEMPVTYATIKNLNELQALYLSKTGDEIKELVKRGELDEYVSNDTLTNYLTNEEFEKWKSGNLTLDETQKLIDSAIDKMKEESKMEVTDGTIYINGYNTGIKVCNAENAQNCPKDSIGVCPNNPEALCVNGQEVFKIITGSGTDIKYEDNCLVLNGEKTVCNGNANVKIENNCIIVGNDKLCVDKGSSSSNDIEFRDNCYYRNGKLDVCKVSTSPNNTGTVSNPKTGIGMILYFIVPSVLVVGFSIFYKRYRKQKYEM